MQLHNKAKDQLLNFLPMNSLPLNITEVTQIQNLQLYVRARSAQVCTLQSLTEAKQHLNRNTETVFQVLDFGPEWSPAQLHL